MAILTAGKPFVNLTGSLLSLLYSTTPIATEIRLVTLTSWLGNCRLNGEIDGSSVQSQDVSFIVTLGIHKLRTSVQVLHFSEISGLGCFAA